MNKWAVRVGAAALALTQATSVSANDDRARVGTTGQWANSYACSVYDLPQSGLSAIRGSSNRERDRIRYAFQNRARLGNHVETRNVRSERACKRLGEQRPGNQLVCSEQHNVCALR